MGDRRIAAVALALLLLTSCRQQRIVLCGDSNTEGFGPASQGFDRTHDLAGHLSTALGGSWDVMSRANGGMGYTVWWTQPGTTPSRNQDLADALALQPYWHVILLGSNDLNRGVPVADIVAEATYQHAQVAQYGGRSLIVGHLYPATNDTALDAALSAAFGADYVAPPAFVEADYVEPAGQAHVHLNDQGLTKLAAALKAKIAP